MKSSFTTWSIRLSLLGLLILGAGENSFRLCPPLVIDQEQADFAVTTLDKIITEIEKTV